jgi:hypothetical protein
MRRTLGAGRQTPPAVDTRHPREAHPSEPRLPPPFFFFCPVRKPPILMIKRPARPYNRAIQKMIYYGER